MLELALIGKNISHSRSESIYQGLLKKKFNYTLLDFESEDKIWTLDELKNKFHGVSITSPYKKYYVNEVEDHSGLGIINTLRFSNSRVEATNTDFLAVNSILENYIKSGVETVHLLGDGSMAEITKTLLDKHSVNQLQYSRKLNNLSVFENSSITKDASDLVINTCARDYSFQGSFLGSFHFWDMNYDMDNHKKYFQSSKVNYFDGAEQLLLQARFALDFWGF